jgi:type II secretory pathway pseudopilin PulG
MNMKSSSGFSFVESLVVTGIISILTAMSVVAIPAIRAHQELVADTENLRALLLDAKQRTVNQVRPEGCLSDLAVEDVGRAICSDTGVALVNGEIIQFANTSAVSSQRYDANDFVLTRSKLASKVDTGSVSSLLFVGVPPSADLYVNGSLLRGANPSGVIKFSSRSGVQRTIRVYSFGTITVR